MEKMRNGGIAGLAAVLILVLSACGEPTRWSSPVKVVVLNDALHLSDLLPDTMWAPDDGLLRVEFEQTVAEFGVGGQLDFLDTTWTDTFTLPFGGGPIPVAPNTVIWEESDELKIAVPGTNLRRIRLKSGKMTLSVSSSVQGPLELTYMFLGGDFPNLPADEIVLEVNQNTATLEVDLAGAWLMLDGISGQEFNRLETAYIIRTTENGGENTPLYGDDMFSVTFTFEDVVPHQIEGDFGQPHFDMIGAVDFPNFDFIQQAEITWDDIACEFLMVNTLGVDLGLSLNSLTRWRAGVPLELEHQAMGQTAMLSRALIGEWNSTDWTSSPTSSWHVDLGESGSNLELWAGVFPDSIQWDIDVEFNPLGDVTGGYDRVDFDELPQLIMDLSIPMRIRIDGLALGDTTDTFDTFSVEKFGEAPFVGDLVVQFENGFDIAMRLDAVTVPSPRDFFFDAVVLLDGFEVPRQGMSTARIPIDAELWRVLSNGRGIAWKASIDSGNEQIEIGVQDSLALNGWLDGQFNWVVE
jgi:hypothetical protein